MSGKVSKQKNMKVEKMKTFEWSEDKEPHAARRKEIRKKYGSFSLKRSY